ncbi:Nucleoside triphosphate pyrophosphohydrolase [Nitrospira sp. KM1]|uniref:nucleoside triphosphate pyrophosphohydrolase n=1 Tax=Nitrospira sp. KM1 TaxID=1936990 RepID=UPI0013A75254|nr:nucleoside triphosphate pyrophosphohydrolase [Nitrospira sp. KM1]BCA56328.1 Nucleoside triphosphate pyrophosphohydrolase [Nitrospira sp. KM1]
MSERFQKLIALMAALRAPEGCPWDRKQTHESLKPYLIEETYEVLDAIDHADRAKLPEELGDVLLQVLFHSQIASEAGHFTVDTVLDQLADKLIRRHPHVFPNGSTDPKPANADQVLARWEDIKQAERRAAGRPESVLDGVPKTLPALLRAYQIQARASRVGFDWTQDETGFDQVLSKIEEEIRELRMAIRATGSDSDGRQRHIADEFGDVLFSLVNLARFIKVNPEDALRQSISRFIERFQYIETRASASGRSVGELSLDEMNGLWDEAKRRGSEGARP